MKYNAGEKVIINIDTMINNDADHDLDIATSKNKKKKYRIMVVKYWYADVEAIDESDALNLVDDMQENDFDWTDFDDAEIIEEIDY